MRFMMQVRADKNTEAGILPSKELVAAMGKFNEENFPPEILSAEDAAREEALREELRRKHGA